MENIYYLFSVKDQYFTELSLVLKRKGLFQSFYGLAYAKTVILKNPIYTHVSYISDIVTKRGIIDYAFLQSIEERYNISIAELIHIDRHLIRYDKNHRLYIAQELLKLFIAEVTQFKIDVVFVEGIDDFISLFACEYCKYHHIRFLFPTYIGYASRACFSNNIYAGPNNFEQNFQENLDLIRQGKIDGEKIEAELINYININKKPSYSQEDDNNYKMLSFADIKTFCHYLSAFIRDRNGMHYDRSPLLIPFHRLIRIIRHRHYSKFLASQPADIHLKKEFDYLIYPLQLEPESSILIQGRWLNDQKKIIEIISKNLPVNTVLLVKEHKVSLGRRKASFYKNITSHHNVFLIDHKTDTYKLIEGSKGVVLISSTMGLEALMLKKPVMSFGERYYNASGNVYAVSNYKEIYQTVRNLLAHKFDWLDTLALFHTLFSSTVEDMGCHIHFGYNNNDLEKMAVTIENYFST